MQPVPLSCQHRHPHYITAVANNYQQPRLTRAVLDQHEKAALASLLLMQQQSPPLKVCLRFFSTVACVVSWFSKVGAQKIPDCGARLLQNILNLQLVCWARAFSPKYTRPLSPKAYTAVADVWSPAERRTPAALLCMACHALVLFGKAPIASAHHCMQAPVGPYTPTTGLEQMQMEQMQTSQPSCETSDTCSETGSSSHPPPRKAARRCLNSLAGMATPRPQRMVRSSRSWN